MLLLLVLWLGAMAKATSEAPGPMPGRRLYSIDETAQLLSLHPKTVYDMAYSRKLHTVKLGRRRLVPAEEVDRLLEDLRSESAG